MDLQKCIYSFFNQVISKNPVIFERLSSFVPDIELIDDTLFFNLKGLYNITSKDHGLQYTEFRKQLYASSINHDLNRLGYKVTIHISGQQIDSTIYKLVKC